ncbi:preprotein translocase subunit SecA [Tenacibaculum maritimum]|uniref:preprotein translocase subunit SecA n=1 Tax=Tenacibaculum maritimum TaxID=107401 RepID=UPI000418061B|nr:preprotein translocase subunit SecA [Tenacibaculum maritimum]MCD9561809.1 preprotein translocase subunit SecA [Tenacibaculum maritimum]MCD9565245.1 preprotein translocase subunit SecA [Tenacibaculum maritimum]MCD9578645.1 preprotein translocase subunit SecA [Tenacibaculum maritimum]MCD9585241.1 preprotein translocase subunit SecA [Tenacibaculum maritimum]MCD9596489.1 preprotein translocase subunit SecA [Tenacibaculum maritimum]
MNILNSVIKLFVGDKQQKDLKTLQPIVDKVTSFEKKISQLSNDELRQKSNDFKTKIKEATKSFNEQIATLEMEAKSADIDRQEDIYAEIDELKDQSYKASEAILQEIMPEAFCVVKETAKRFTNNKQLEVTATPFDRELSAFNPHITLDDQKAYWANSWDAAGKPVTWDMIHYDVQLMGGAVLHQGKIAEMMTGEGKTLVSTLPIYLNALTGNGVHVVTVNDYLAKRDKAWMAPIFEFHGLTTDCIDYHQPNSEARRKAYNADITYGTNNEFGFDYLRDNMANSKEDLVQRAPNYAIIDEVDSVLIDDARTPLIISGPVPQGDRHEFNELKPLVADLVALQSKYLVGVLAEAKKLIASGDTKEGGFQLLRVHRGLPKNKALIKFLSQEGVKQILQKTENFYMQDNNKLMPEVDAELYFVVEEKNNQIDLTDKGINHLSDKTQNDTFFVLPDISVKVGEIDKSSASPEEKANQKEELYRDFSVKSERIHTMNQLLKAYTVFEKDVEYVVIDNKVMIVDEQTGRIMDGRRYSDGLHQALEAKENVNIEDATQTFATVTLQNYFRMYRKLSGMTGTAITEAGELLEIYKLDVVEIPTNKPIQRDDKEDLVYKTAREKYNAVIEDIVQLVNQGRPVLVGTTSVEISELLGRMLQMRKIPHNILNAKLHKREADVVAEAGKPGVVTIATNMAGRGTDIKLSKEVKDAGGLAIIGTERHDSRRVDRQLRGRAGRQGDVGSSQFYVALDDNLMRLFGSDRIAKMMDRMGLKEGEVIQHSMITKSIERAQKKVEENNFGIRKRLLEYDDIMNAQREFVYKRRRHALDGKRLEVDIANMIYDTCESIIKENKPTKNFQNFEFELIRFSSMTSPFSEEEFNQATEKELADKLYEIITDHYKKDAEKNALQAFPVIKDVYENEGDRYERIVVPFTDGAKTLQVVTNLKEAYESEGKSLVTDFEKNITLAIIDENWKDHLRKMDELKQTVQNATYEQKDPLLVYKFEAFNLFQDTIDKINKEVLSFLFKGKLPSQDASQVSEAHEQKPEKLNLRKDDVQNSTQQAIQNSRQEEPEIVETIVREQPKIGRNERITIKNVMTGEEKEVKYKQAIPLLEQGTWVLYNK